jgi:CheY-like chemotaxis protein
MVRILIIDDNDPFRYLLRLTLEQAGYEVVDACNGREGLSRYRAAPTDVVIIDLFMPTQEGLETIQALRRERPTVKIIAISGGDRTGKALNRQDACAILQRIARQAHAHLSPEAHIHVSPQVRRHTLLRQVANEKGVHDAMALSGHRSDRYSWRYVQPDAQSLADALDALDEPAGARGSGLPGVPRAGPWL